MTPEEKAVELVSRFYYKCYECDESKRNALIAVDEILKAVEYPSPQYSFYKEVYQEIEKL